MNLGSKVKDKITGLEGFLTGKATYITGCDQYLVQPPTKDGDYKEGRWIDEGRLVLIEDSAIQAETVKAEANGCDASAPFK